MICHIWTTTGTPKNLISSSLHAHTYCTHIWFALREHSFNYRYNKIFSGIYYTVVFDLPPLTQKNIISSSFPCMPIHISSMFGLNWINCLWVVAVINELFTSIFKHFYDPVTFDLWPIHQKSNFIVAWSYKLDPSLVTN